MAKILWQREADARRDLALAVMRLSDLPDAMYEHLMPPAGTLYHAPRWRTNMCGTESQAIDLLRYARESLAHHVAYNPKDYGVLSRVCGPKWKFRHVHDPDHTILSLACAGPQASYFVRNEPMLLGACVRGCMGAYWPGHHVGRGVDKVYCVVAIRMLRLWMSTLLECPDTFDDDVYQACWILKNGWRKMVAVSRIQAGELENFADTAKIDLNNYYSNRVDKLRRIYTRGCSVMDHRVDDTIRETSVCPEDGRLRWHLFGRSCFNWADAIIDACETCEPPNEPRALRFDIWHEPGPCGVAWLDEIVSQLPAPAPYLHVARAREES